MSYPLFKVHVDVPAALKNIEDVLTSGFINEGEIVTQFQKELCKYFGSEYVVLTNSCTSSLTMALAAAGVKQGDEVITTAMTCVATNMPILQLGATPVWADIKSVTGNIDPSHVKQLITEKTKAIMCVDWAGLPCEMNELRDICDKNHIKLISDGAHSLGTFYGKKHISHYADFSCYSFQAIKHITTGDGGAVIAKNESDFKELKKLKWFGLDRDATKNAKGEWKGQRWESDITAPGYKFNMNNLAAALGLSQIPHLDDIITAHRSNGLLFESLFKDSSLVNSLIYPQDSKPSFWVYTCLLHEKVNRDNVLRKLNELGINAGLVHIPNHEYSCFSLSKKELPETDYFFTHQISLPCGWWLDKGDIKHIASTVLSACEEEFDEFS